MLLAMNDTDFSELINGVAPRGLHLPDSPLAPTEILAMLRALAGSIAIDFTPAAWMIVDEAEIVGLCSIVSPPIDQQLKIGYGVAPTRQGRGATTRAIADLLVWARTDDRIAAVIAETGVDNLPSQTVLSRNGFQNVGHRTDAEDGEVICWHASTKA
jgi:RimJ/RimL family protein N-acetyltransferase